MAFLLGLWEYAPTGGDRSSTDLAGWRVVLNSSRGHCNVVSFTLGFCIRIMIVLCYSMKLYCKQRLWRA